MGGVIIVKWGGAFVANKQMLGWPAAALVRSLVPSCWEADYSSGRATKLPEGMHAALIAPKTAPNQ